MAGDVIEVVGPRDPDVFAILERHHAHARAHTAPEDIYALDADGLADPAVTLVGLRRGGRLLGIGALKDLGGGEGELKSMHTLEEARGSGVAGALVDHLLGVARAAGMERVSLETGVGAGFAAAWALYESRGFATCGAFADYPQADTSRFMTLAL